MKEGQEGLGPGIPAVLSHRLPAAWEDGGGVLNAATDPEGSELKEVPSRRSQQSLRHSTLGMEGGHIYVEQLWEDACKDLSNFSSLSAFLYCALRIRGVILIY